MKIAREINGNTVEIELTEDELYDAYNEQKTLFDKEDVREELVSGRMDTLMDDYGLTMGEADALVDEMVYRVQRNISKYGMTREAALCIGVKEVLEEHSKRPAPAAALKISAPPSADTDGDFNTFLQFCI